ncbi:zinc-finger domain-containing protein [Lysinibacillus alkalisoli]|uniref:zinc-finger domain-containing protein n=1 Tax=Lysinibacillus alkalisoli TaxID=1911548 RepID=UPI001E59B334|nr:zinc-finger domain-containing protein [Lysinibacillus alkalisoli]
MTQPSLIENMDQLHDAYCKDCPIKAVLRKEQGKRKAHEFCITTCSVGHKLKELGNSLLQQKS